MYCACIWDDESQSVTRFFWVSTMRRARKLVAKYRQITGMSCFIEGERSIYNVDNALGR